MSGRKLILRFILAALAIGVGSYLAIVTFSKRPEPQQRKVTSMPPVYSKIPTIEILSSKVIEEGTPGASVEIEVKNNSPKAVMAIDLVCGEGGVTRNGLTDEENPIVVIEPYGTAKLHMTFGAMTPDAPLVISAVTYEDGMEEGDAKSLELMHRVRQRDRERLRAERQKERKP